MKKFLTILNLMPIFLIGCTSTMIPKPVSWEFSLNVRNMQAGGGDPNDINTFEDLPDLSGYFRDQIRKLHPTNPTSLDRSKDAPWLSSVDFSGVSWSNKRTATVIHPQLVLMAAHYHRRVGEQITWTDRNGNEVTRTVIDLAQRPRDDQMLGLLDRPLPNTVKVYKVLPHFYRWDKALPGSWILATDQEGKALAYSIIRCTYNRFYQPSGDNYYSWLINYGWEARGHEPPPYVLWERLISGDSGNPSFLLYEGEPILIDLHWSMTTGAMPTDEPWYLDRAREMLARTKGAS